MMLTGRDIICISSVDWDFHWQIHHEIMSTLASHGNRVLFIENTGVRAPGVSDIGRVAQRVRNWWHSTKGFRQERDNLFVYSPLFLPLPYSRLARWVNRTFMFRPLRRWMSITGFKRPIVWTFLPTPTARDIIKDVDPLITIYYCADDFAASSHGARRIRWSEEEFYRQSDLVFVTSQKLYERARAFTDRVHRFPAGVNYEQFARVGEEADGVPADLKALGSPVAGYVGALHVWLDQDLIVELATRLPDVRFALVGPAHADTARLEACSNVHLLGGRPHAEVPRYIKGFDVGLVPYRASEYTDSVYPVKLNEYLAMGVPVVASDIPEIRRFNEEHGGVLTVARDAAEFAAAIGNAIGASCGEAAERRRAVAQANSWGTRIGAMSILIARAIAERQRGRDRWEERLRRVYRRARQRAVEIGLGIVLAYTLLFYTPLVWTVASPLRLDEPPRAADAIVVFAGGVGESGQAGGGYQERIKQAVDLYLAGYAQRIVVSSGYVFAFREAEVMKTLAVESGVPAEAVLLETKAANTHENVLFVYDILRERGWSRILLVSSPYHMKRAVMTWKMAAPEVDVIPEPVPTSQFYLREGPGASIAQIRGIAQEYAAIVVYWWRGWL